MPCAMPSQLPGQPRTIWIDLKAKVGLATWDDGAWVQVRGCFCCWWYLLTGSDVAMFPRRVVLVALTGPFELTIRSPVVPRPGFQVCTPSQVDTVSSRDTSHSDSGQSGCFHSGPLALAHSWQRVWFALALLRQCPRWRLVLALAFFWQPLVSASGLALRQCYLPCHTTPQAPTLRVLQQLPSQPCLQARCWRFPCPGLVWHPRPAVLPLVHAHRLP